jgi:ABC-2 type transport system permease protein
VKRLFASESIKIRTLWSTWVLLGVAATVVAVLSVVVAFAPHSRGSQAVLLPPEGSRGWFDDIFEVMNVAGDFALVLGVITITGEYRHKTITPSFLAEPRRGRLVLAKTEVCAIAGAVVAIAVGIVGLVFGLSVVAGGYGTMSTMFHEFGRVWIGLAAATVLFAVYGVGVGALLKNQVAALMVALGFSAIVEPILEGVVPSVGRFMPGAAAQALEAATSRRGPFTAGELFHLLTWWEGALVLVAYGAVFAVAGSLTTMRADVT